ncbi:MAG: hypothetical protein ACTSVC_08315 [Promethearchaeota archaeon]
MNKKNIFIIIGIILLIIILIIIYMLFKSQKKETTFNKQDNLLIEKINSNSVIFDKKDNSFKYISNDNKKIMRFDLGNSKKSELYTISSKEKIFKAIWSENKTQCLVLMGDDQNRFYRFIDLIKNQHSDLDNKINNPVFSPDGKKITYWYKESNKDSITIANPDGTNWKTIYQFDSLLDEFESVNLYWILDEYIYYSIISESESIYSDLYKINTSEGNSKPQKILDGYSAIFGDKYPKLLIDIDNNLQIYDLKTQQKKNTNKKLYHLSNYYYIDSNNILVIANESSKDIYSNSFYLIDLNSGKVDLIYSFGDNKDLKNKNIIYCFYSEDNKIIYFVIDESLYKIKLDLDKYLK